jgi:hypothetical protein
MGLYDLLKLSPELRSFETLKNACAFRHITFIVPSATDSSNVQNNHFPLPFDPLVAPLFSRVTDRLSLHKYLITRWCIEFCFVRDEFGLLALHAIS